MRRIGVALRALPAEGVGGCHRRARSVSRAQRQPTGAARFAGLDGSGVEQAPALVEAHAQPAWSVPAGILVGRLEARGDRVLRERG